MLTHGDQIEKGHREVSLLFLFLLYKFRISD
jgi:hypothetical protein